MLLYHLFKPVVTLALKIFWRPRLVGEENIPSHGPAVLASAHVAAADTFFMPALVHRTVRFLGKSDFFTGGSLLNRILGLFLRSVGVMPVNRSGGAASRSALAAGMSVLREGGLVGIYPEGTRSPDGRLYRGKTGAARLALEAGCPVVPIAMLGAHEAQRGRRFFPRRRPRITVLIGGPLDVQEIARAAGEMSEGERLRTVTDAIMAAIAELSGQEQVAEYAADAKRRLAAERAGDGD